MILKSQPRGLATGFSAILQSPVYWHRQCKQNSDPKDFEIPENIRSNQGVNFEAFKTGYRRFKLARAKLKVYSIDEIARKKGENAYSDLNRVLVDLNTYLALRSSRQMMDGCRGTTLHYVGPLHLGAIR